jgi:hypothetical protein
MVRIIRKNIVSVVISGSTPASSGPTCGDMLPARGPVGKVSAITSNPTIARQKVAIVGRTRGAVGKGAECPERVRRARGTVRARGTDGREIKIGQHRHDAPMHGGTPVTLGVRPDDPDRDRTVSTFCRHPHHIFAL